MASSPDVEFETTEIDDEMFPEASLDAPAPTTPRLTSSHLPPVTELSPPNSQSRGAQATAGNARAQAALEIVGGAGVLNGVGSATNLRSGGAGPVKVDESTGYQWIRPEDEPGYAWKNRKAQEEAVKALDQIVDKEKMVGARYGDLLMEQRDTDERS